MICQICKSDPDIDKARVIIKIGRHEWCHSCIRSAIVMSEDEMRQRYAHTQTHGERELEKRRAARQNALKDFNSDKW
jgi:hypothetical protein